MITITQIIERKNVAEKHLKDLEIRLFQNSISEQKLLKEKSEINIEILRTQGELRALESLGTITDDPNQK